MSGIAGIYAFHYAANPIDRDELARIRDRMSARGPDASPDWYSEDGRLALGHRLQYDQQTGFGAQPLASRDGQTVVVFDGEIHNSDALRRGLESTGCSFRSDSHAEIILNLYAVKGAELLTHLEGAFACAIWDVRRESLLLARDPFGTKPLYYADDGWTVRFASQVKALLAGGKISKIREPAGIAGFYLFGGVPEPFTVYQDIRSVPAGSVVQIDRTGTREPKRYFSIAEQLRHAAVAHNGHPRVQEVELLEATREALSVALRRYVSSGRTGVFLLDALCSAALVALIPREIHQDLQTIALSFEGGSTNLGRALFVEGVASHYGIRHLTRRVSEAEFQADLPQILNAMDQPTIGGIVEWFAAKAAHEAGLKIAISALGGNELLGQDASNFCSQRAMTGWVSASLQQTPAGLSCPSARGLSTRLLFTQAEVETILGKRTTQIGLRRLRLMDRAGSKMASYLKFGSRNVAELATSKHLLDRLLRDSDWASASHSIIVRTPFLDRDILRGLTSIIVNRYKRQDNAARSLAETLFAFLLRDGMPFQRLLAPDGPYRRDVCRSSASDLDASWAQARRWAIQVGQTE